MIGVLVLFGVFGPKDIDENNSPQFIQADFIDLDRIYSISKFRSGSGHDFSGNGETCRSMKHYFNTQDTQEKLTAWDENNGIPPLPTANTAISIYSPVDGKIIRVEEEEAPIGQQIYIVPEDELRFTIRLFHVYLLPELDAGSKIVAGQKIGEISAYSNTDIAITVGRYGNRFVSYFEVMPDNIFAKYLARGVEDRDELIITEEERDASPLQCNGERFAINYDSVTGANEDHFVRLSGWKSEY